MFTFFTACALQKRGQDNVIRKVGMLYILNYFGRFIKFYKNKQSFTLIFHNNFKSKFERVT